MRVTQMNPFLSHSEPRHFASPPLPPANITSPSPVSEQKNLFNIKNFKKDDWILLCIIGTLVLEGSSDYILLIALGYLFLVGLQD